MKCKIIADAGSSKTDWSVTDMSGAEIKRFSTPGLNALLAEPEEIEACLATVAAENPAGSSVAEINYYGAGCATPAICEKIEKALRKVLQADEVHVASDLCGAARSLLGHEAGIACILGTGSNSCLYDGNAIVHNIPSLGYILGDEGSGGAIGKRLVADAFKGHLPKQVEKSFFEEFGLDISTLLSRVYREPSPNKFLASLVPFVHRNLSDVYVHNMVREEFERFLSRNVAPYKNSGKLPVCFTGSIALHFEDVLREACNRCQLKVGKITGHPLDGLVQFHRTK